MRSNHAFLSRCIATLVAAIFVIAVEPGAMAMNTPQPASAAACGDHAKMACHHHMPQKERKAPCKSMSACLGMLNCFGMAALAADHAALPQIAARAPVPYAHSDGDGISPLPDNPPPIA
jgi:hypothetical protein